MAIQIKSGTKDLYEEDSYVWAERQAALLRAGRFGELDLEHLVEEVEELAVSARKAVRSNARVIMEHLLKLQHSPAQDPRTDWQDTVIEHRVRLENELTPRLRQLLIEDLAQAYRLARRKTSASMRVHGEHAAADALPAECPYTLDQILGDWLP